MLKASRIITLTTEKNGQKTGSDRPGAPAGHVESFRQRGVWVPDGMTAEEIMVGAAVLEEKYEVEHYTARSMVRLVLEAIRRGRL